MKSIRLSLVLYFLVLVALALGAVSGLAYWTASRILQSREDATVRIVQEREKATGELLKAQYERRRLREKIKLDNALRGQARILANLAQFQVQGNRSRYQILAPVGLVTAGPAPDGFLLASFWTGTTCCGPLSSRMSRLCATEIQFDEARVPPSPDGPIKEFFQITSEWGHVWRSRSMDDFAFPVDAETFDKTPPLDWQFDELELEPDLHVRRVTMKAPASRFRVFGDGIRPGEGTPPMLLIQCASDTARRDEALREAKEHLDEELEGVARASRATLDDLAAESRETLATLRNRLLGVALSTFALTVVGGFCLVRLGLAPLARLSEAVSRVSANDLRLQFEEPRLSSELRPIAERLTEALDQLRHAFDREKQAAADISHELRTPLAALLTTVEVALRKPRGADEYREVLGDCHSIGTQMSQLVERLLALTRLDAGVDRLRLTRVDAADVAEQCVMLVRPLAEARDLELRLHHDGPAYLTADPDKLREVVTNLLHNAIEYNQPRGSVDLSVARENGHLRVEVRDTGVGIAPEARKHIFERFYRADPSRHAAGMHAGLGLAIVKGYVDLMGGSISVESVEGAGSTFRVSLPAGESDEATRRGITPGAGR